MIHPSEEDFFEACGARSPLHLEVERRGRQERERRTLNLPFAVIGRDERAELRLEDGAVSHRHAYLQLVAGNLWCVDLGSRTGTHGESGGQVVGPLLGRQGVRIGPYTIRRADEHSANSAPALAPANPLTRESDDPSLPRWSLEFQSGMVQQRSWGVDRAVTLIGRAAFCKIRLHGSLVSRTHCVLLNTPAGLWLIDLLAREGTYVNGQAVRWGRLEQGDELQIDQFRIRVCAPNPALTYAAPSAEMAVPEGETVHRQETLLPIPAATPAGLAVPMNGNESLLLPLISQFSLMQQQMFDQFQQTLLLMAQMFGNLHREQMALVRQELDQIQDLTRQLQALQAEWPRQTPAPPPIAAESRSQIEPNRSATPPPTPPHSSARCEGDVHLWLAQRLATLQQDRQSRWQRLLGLLSGK